MAESATVTTRWRGKLCRIRCAWQADGAGNKADVSLGAIDGRIVQIVTDPGSTAPAASYDLTLEDEYGNDLAGGAIANRSATATEVVRPSDGSNPIDRWTQGDATLTFSNLTNADCNGDVFVFYVSE